MGSRRMAEFDRDAASTRRGSKGGHREIGKVEHSSIAFGADNEGAYLVSCGQGHLG